MAAARVGTFPGSQKAKDPENISERVDEARCIVVIDANQQDVYGNLVVIRIGIVGGYLGCWPSKGSLRKSGAATIASDDFPATKRIFLLRKITQPRRKANA
jgi:hypothetical protein